MSQLYDVIIAGAGPVGLFLACELRLAGATVLVLERDLNPESEWKVFPQGRRGLQTTSVETLYRRGLLGKFLDIRDRPSTLEKTHGFKSGGHFAGIELDLNKLDLARRKYRLDGPSLLPCPTSQERIETVLSERALSLGATILGDVGVTNIAAQDEESVTVEAGENKSFSGRWLVGCDGGRSLIRKTAGFEFTGTEAKFTGYILTCDLDHPEKLNKGMNLSSGYIFIPGQPNTLYLLDFDNATFDRTKEITRERLQPILNRLIGRTDVNITKVHLATSFTDRSKQATSYRKGRVLLAGDAAHIHSPLGAQGLNIGLGDAMNLGWKLGATIRQEAERSGGAKADLSLLDTYEAERHPIAAWALEWTRAQVTTLQPDLFGAAVRKLIRDVIDTTDGTNLFIDRVWGLSQQYKLGGGEAHSHPLIGSSMPDFELRDGSRLGPKLEGGRGLLVDFEDDAALKELVVGGSYGARVDYCGGDVRDRCGLRALLVRPDGVVAWVAEDSVKPDMVAVKTALEHWFGF